MTTLTSKAVFHLASQSSTGFVSGAVSMNRVSGFVAVHPCCNAAELCEVKKLIGVTALTSKAVFHLASQSSTGEVSMNRVSGFVAVHPCCNAAELCEV